MTRISCTATHRTSCVLWVVNNRSQDLSLEVWVSYFVRHHLKDMTITEVNWGRSFRTQISYTATDRTRSSHLQDTRPVSGRIDLRYLEVPLRGRDSMQLIGHQTSVWKYGSRSSRGTTQGTLLISGVKWGMNYRTWIQCTATLRTLLNKSNIGAILTCVPRKFCDPQQGLCQFPRSQFQQFQKVFSPNFRNVSVKFQELL